MAKIHIDCEDAILACEKAIEKHKLSHKKSCEEMERQYDSYKERNTNADGFAFAGAVHRSYKDYSEMVVKINNLKHSAAYLKHKNRRLILDIQSEEFGLISEFLPTE